ncbi:hypothetical protein BX265_3591 [Streptomyces sp. TLI_235]|jgi:hypothetical protein|nr:hypothetical protein BX265_3591 [Streptomyces sp. TLI_235]
MTPDALRAQVMMPQPTGPTPTTDNVTRRVVHSAKNNEILPGPEESASRERPP